MERTLRKGISHMVSTVQSLYNIAHYNTDLDIIQL